MVQTFYLVMLFWDYTELLEVAQQSLGYGAEKKHLPGFLKGDLKGYEVTWNLRPSYNNGSSNLQAK